jgi:hypothetical protein
LNAIAQKKIAAAFTDSRRLQRKKALLAVIVKQKHKIKINDIFSQDHITVVHDGKSYDFKGQIYTAISCAMVKPTDSPATKTTGFESI